MARTKNEALHAQRNIEILEAAARVFKAKGFHLARTEDICIEAEISAGTLFRHFPDKRSMIMAIAEIELEHYRAGIEKLASREGIQWMASISTREFNELLKPKGFELGTDSWLEFARDPESRERLLEFDKQLRQLFSKQLKRGQNEGWVQQSIDCTGTANLILALLSGLMFDREMGFAVDAKSTAKSVSDLFKNFVLA